MFCNHDWRVIWAKDAGLTFTYVLYKCAKCCKYHSETLNQQVGVGIMEDIEKNNNKEKK